ncbi:cystathionine gamma-lyase [bacterium]|nr:cystathionine gamma-lyase [bacterium]
MTADRRFADMLHHRAERLGRGDPVAPPLISATTFHLPGLENAAYKYGRMAMPTWEEVEEQLAILEGATVVGFPSGMAAIAAALMCTLSAGQTVILPADGYYTTRLLADRFLAPLGVKIRLIDTKDVDSADFTGASVVFLETPSNPGLDCCDISLAARKAHAAGARLIVDNTTMTALLQRPLDLGADLVVAADTKAPAGHSDVLYGHVSGRDAALMARIAEWRKLSGAVPGAFEAWLLHRGLETLEVRLARMCASAGILAERLSSHPRIKALRYPGLPSDPAHAIARRQMQGFGFLMSFELESEEKAEEFLTRSAYVTQTTSFGGTHSAGERRARWGDAVAPGFIRFSVGVEPVEPLWDAIEQALKPHAKG